MENEIYKKVIEIVENCMFEMGYIMRPHADETDDFLIELEKDLNEKLPLPSVSREKAEEVLKEHCNTQFNVRTGDEEVLSSVSSIVIAMEEYARLVSLYIPLSSPSSEEPTRIYAPMELFFTILKKNDWDAAMQLIKAELTGLPVTQVIDGELMVFIASHEPEAPAPSNHKTYYCSVCHKVPVDAENGFDTCSDCVSKI